MKYFILVIFSLSGSLGLAALKNSPQDIVYSLCSIKATNGKTVSKNDFEACRKTHELLIPAAEPVDIAISICSVKPEAGKKLDIDNPNILDCFEEAAQPKFNIGANLMNQIESCKNNYKMPGANLNICARGVFLRFKHFQKRK